jgi:hypothetical protein
LLVLDKSRSDRKEVVVFETWSLESFTATESVCIVLFSVMKDIINLFNQNKNKVVYNVCFIVLSLGKEKVPP